MYKNVMLAAALVVLGSAQAMKPGEMGDKYQADTKNFQLQNVVQAQPLTVGEMVVVAGKKHLRWASVEQINKKKVTVMLGVDDEWNPILKEVLLNWVWRVQPRQKRATKVE